MPECKLLQEETVQEVQTIFGNKIVTAPSPESYLIMGGWGNRL